MQLTQFTDYSLRMLIYVAVRNGKTCTITEIAESYNISIALAFEDANYAGSLETARSV